jgi:hypothetical protein
MDVDRTSSSSPISFILFITAPLKGIYIVCSFTYSIHRHVKDVEDCPSREVIIYLQHGSFPVISADNATFARNFYIARSGIL